MRIDFILECVKQAKRVVNLPKQITYKENISVTEPSCVAIASVLNSKNIHIVSEQENHATSFIEFFKRYKTDSIPNPTDIIFFKNGSAGVVTGYKNNKIYFLKKYTFSTCYKTSNEIDFISRPPYEDNGMQLGIDVSTFQSSIDWDKVKSCGVSFAIIRSSVTGSSKGSLSIDKYFNQNISKVTVPYGIYHYSVATSVQKAKEEARFALSCLNGKQAPIGIFMDIEDAKMVSLSNNAIMDIFYAFREVIVEAGYICGLYSGKSLEYKFDIPRLKKDKVPIWFAQYYYQNTMKNSKDVNIWQFNSGSPESANYYICIDGVPSVGLDVNISYGNPLNFYGFELSEIGTPCTWLSFQDDWYFYGSDGKLEKNKWMYHGDTSEDLKGFYYLKEDGKMAVSEWIKNNNDNQWYYLKSNGKMAELEWIEYKNEWYYLGDSGKLKTGWVQYNGNWYYLRTLDDSKDGHPEGSAFTGWARLKWENDIKWYYFEPTNNSKDMPQCAMHRNCWIKYKGNDYFLKTDGAMACNENIIIDGLIYQFDNNGIVVHKKNV